MLENTVKCINYLLINEKEFNMTLDEKKIVELLGINEPIKSVIVVFDSTDENVQIKLGYEMESYHIIGGELVLYIKKNSNVKYEKVLKNKNQQQIEKDIRNESTV